jgi:DNA-binding CsgD family transcriptional regulator
MLRMVHFRRPGFIELDRPEIREFTAPDEPIAFDVTGRQLECLAWAGEGKTAIEIGIILGISARTVEGHLAKVCEGLGVRKRIQAAIRARELGVLPDVRRANLRAPRP